jgi:hypothetical protein
MALLVAPPALVALLLTDIVTFVRAPTAEAGVLDRATAATVNVDMAAAAASNLGTFLKVLVISIWSLPFAGLAFR